jgi:hypothetical protein
MGLFVRTIGTGPGDHQNLPRQPGLQHAPPALAGTPAGTRLTRRSRGSRAPATAHATDGRAPFAPSPCDPPSSKIAVDEGLQVEQHRAGAPQMLDSRHLTEACPSSL